MFDSAKLMYATGGGAGFYDTEISQSLRLNDNDSAYLSRTPASAGNRKTWTWSGWVKRGNIPAANQTLLAVRPTSTPSTSIQLLSTYNFRVQDTGNSTDLRTDALFRDPSSWYHFVVSADTTQATASDRVKIYVNGSQIIDFSTETYPSQNTDFLLNSVNEIQLGITNLTSWYFDGYLAEMHFVDGTALAPTSFGEFKSGVWIPKAYTGSYGTNGFYLDFDGTYYNDKSGNGNNWTANNLAATDVVLDSPTNNFATLNPLGTSTATFSEGNLRGNLSVTNGAASATMASGSGKYYWEILGSSYSNNGMVIGVRNSDNPSSGTYGADGVFYYANGGSIYVDGSVTDTVATYGVTDIIGVAIDLDSDTVKFYKNNSLQITKSLPQTGKTWQPQFGEGTSAGDNAFLANFGQDSSFAGNKTAQGNTDANGIGDFYYAPPSGYLALCTANLPDPVASIDPAQDGSPQDHFNTVLYTGNGSTQSITGVGFQPDFVWAKSRSGAHNHEIYDSVRGATQRLMPNTTNAENTQSNGLTSLDTDGFTLGGDDWNVNRSGYTYVAWNWKANGSGVSNTDGSITSTVSANTDAGFSIVSYTGTTTTNTNFTVGHGLGQTPDMVIIKNRDWAAGVKAWQVWASPLGNNSLGLEATNSQSSGDFTYSWNQQPNSTTFTVRADTAVSTSNRYRTNGRADNYIAYCFHSVAGFSKFGSYTGNGSTDGPFVYTGFRPAFVMMKDTDGANSWCMYDANRDTYNVADALLQAQDSAAEATYGGIDFTSNGFKIRSNVNALNLSSHNYIYMCFSENPFKYSNAR